MRMSAAFGALVVVAACMGDDRSTELPTQGAGETALVDSQHLVRSRRAASTASVLDPALCSIAWHSPDPSGCSVRTDIVPAEPRLRQSARDPVQLAPISITFSRPVYGITVSGVGAISCNGTYGTIIAFDAADSELLRVAMQMIDPSDCGVDDITFGATGSTPPATSITRIVIDPPTPFSFPVFPDLTGLMTALYTVTFHDKAIKPELRVACAPTSVLRGDPVTCEATVTGGVPFTVIERRAKGKGFKVSESTPVPVPGGQSFIWDGDAVAATEVMFAVTFSDDGQVRNKTAKATFSIDPRSWRPLQLQQAPTHSIDLGPGMTDYPSNGRLGVFEYAHPVIGGAGTFTQVGTGPNRGLYFFVSEIGLPDISTAWTHPGLYGGRLIGGQVIGLAWYNDQNGQGSGTCTQSVLPGLATMVEVHEGVTRAPNSHWAVANAAFTAEQLHVKLERLYAVSDFELLKRATDLYTGFFEGPYRREQDAFDRKDRPLIFGSLGCQLDLRQGDN